MSKCSFDLPFSDAAGVLVQKFQGRITAAGGGFTGNETSGNFTVKTPVGGVEGAYTIVDSVLKVEILDKPMFLGCGMIEEFIRKELA